MKSAETCSCSLCNKLYTYLYHHIVVLDKYMHSNLVHNLRFTFESIFLRKNTRPYSTVNTLIPRGCSNYKGVPISP